LKIINKSYFNIRNILKNLKVTSNLNAPLDVFVDTDFTDWKQPLVSHYIKGPICNFSYKINPFFLLPVFEGVVITHCN